MTNTAAHFVDRVLPNAAIRQWVLALPFELRALAARDARVLAYLGRIFAEEIARSTKQTACVSGTETGAVPFVQRFGGSLNLHVHFHTLAVDGVFERGDSGVRLHETRPPKKETLQALVQRLHDRTVRWLRRHGYLDAETAGDDAPLPAPLDDFARRLQWL